VHRLPAQGLEHDDVQAALQQIDCVSLHLGGSLRVTREALP
jgi:hypothetical protein